MEPKEILEKLTLEEKIGMIHGAELFSTAGVKRLNIPPLVMSDGPMGVRNEFEPANWKPIGLTDDYVTYLPCNSALAATWNRNLARDTGSVLGEEARGRGKDIILAPGVNIKRSPLCGRNFEYFSEDPYLTKEMAVPYIEGVQSFDVAACVKHFAANSQETERLNVEVEIEEKALREIYLPAFYDAVKKAGSYTIMGAYNRLYGEYCCESDFLLKKILRDEWQYDGVVISDWGGVHDTEKAAKSELDIEMSVTYDFDDYCMANPLKEKVEAGEIDESVIDEKVLRILHLMKKLHMFDGKRKTGVYNTPGHRKAALHVARESIVLLKNEDKVLPLSKKELKKVLLIGENAQCIHSNGGGSAEIKALYELSPLMGIKTHLGGKVKVDYASGYCREEKSEESGQNWQETSLQNGGGSIGKTDTSQEEALVKKRNALKEEALQLAGDKSYDRVIFVGGLNHDHDTEGNDRADMALPYGQDELISQLFAVREDMLVVMIGGSSVDMTAWEEKAHTLVWSYYAGMEGGNALADVLFGDVNPSGKLPETFYKNHMDCSAHALGEFPGGKTVAYKEGKYVGYRYHEKYHIEPLFPFGHGLSYTSFAYRKMSVKPGMVSCYVKNTGKNPGSETAQAYQLVQDGADVVKELKGFEKVYLEPGEEKLVEIAVEGNGPYAVGSSLFDIRLQGDIKL